MSRAHGMPHDLAAERDLLGGILIDCTEHWPTASDLVQAEDFYDARHTHVFRAMMELARAGSPIDVTLLHGQLELAGRLQHAGGGEYLLALTDTIPTGAHIEHLARRVRDLSAAREVVRSAQQLMARGLGDLEDLQDFLDGAETALTSACARRTAQANAVSLSDAMGQAYQALVTRGDTPNKLRGHSTGLSKLDRVLGELCAGEVFVVAARPGMGKSALGQGIAEAAARDGVASLFFSLEMPYGQLADRMLAASSGVALTRIRNARVRDGEWSALSTAAEQLARLPIDLIDEPNLSVLEMRREARRAKRRRPALGLVVVDYLQLARSGQRHESREREVAEISRQLKLLAKREQVAVVALCQLNRGPENRSDRRPMLSDLRESGAIEQDADAVIGIYRDDFYNPKSADPGIAELIVLKQRNGPVGTVKVRWHAALTRFENLAERWEAEGSQ